jgi:hypothetical protein
MTELVDLATDALAKLINDEYSVIVANERANLPKAQALGEKLRVLQSKAKHGEWRDKLKAHCPKVSYETATLYIRLWDKREKLAELAAAKSVTVTDLTIQEARKLLATPKTDSGDNKGKPTKVVKGAVVEPGNEPPSPRSIPPDEQVKRLELDYGDMFEALKRAYDDDDLRQIAERLAEHLKMRLVPVVPLATVSASPVAAALAVRSPATPAPLLDRRS